MVTISNWDKTIDRWGWFELKQRFTWSKTLDFLRGNEIFGIFGFQRSESAGGYHYSLIDLDLHNQPYELFIETA